jgi:hypothetical protein
MALFTIASALAGPMLSRLEYVEMKTFLKVSITSCAGRRYLGREAVWPGGTDSVEGEACVVCC